MRVVCTRCSLFSEAVDLCPRCGAPLPLAAAAAAPAHGPRWQQTAPGRIAIGLVLAQGLFYGLRHLLAGVLLAVSEPGAELWADPRNLFLLHSALALAAFAGGVLAGGGQQLGLALGALAGVCNGVLVTLFRQHPAGDLLGLGFFSQPLLQGLAGLFGGGVGATIWRPIAPLTTGPAAPKKVVAAKGPPLLAGPVAWVRVVIGAACVVAGTLYASRLFVQILDLGGSAVGTAHDFQDRLIIWQIKAFLVLLGAGFAGATTRNGLKQGLFVGVLASFVLVGIQAPAARDPLAMVAYTALATMSLCVVGGWFGGQLLPPVLRTRRPVANGMPAW